MPSVRPRQEETYRPDRSAPPSDRDRHRLRPDHHGRRRDVVSRDGPGRLRPGAGQSRRHVARYIRDGIRRLGRDAGRRCCGRQREPIQRHRFVRASRNGGAGRRRCFRRRRRRPGGPRSARSAVTGSTGSHAPADTGPRRADGHADTATHGRADTAPDGHAHTPPDGCADPGPDAAAAITDSRSHARADTHAGTDLHHPAPAVAAGLPALTLAR